MRPAPAHLYRKSGKKRKVWMFMARLIRDPSHSALDIHVGASSLGQFKKSINISTVFSL